MEQTELLALSQQGLNEMTTIGLDFGTTNSVASVFQNGSPTVVSFGGDFEQHSTFPSALAFWRLDADQYHAQTFVEGGKWAIDAYRTYAPECRLLQSFKSYAGASSFSETRVCGRSFSFEAIMATFIRSMVKHSERSDVWKSTNIVIGRPVRFAGSFPDDDLAMQRYWSALKNFNFENVYAVYEPLAAAYYFVRKLSGDATVFVADLGGGTSDFSVLKISRTGGSLTYAPLASCGTDVAGDRFDYRIIDNIVSHAFGKHSKFNGMGKELPVPNSFYTSLASWEKLSLMRHTMEFRKLKSLINQSLSPRKIERFVDFLELEQTYSMYDAVARFKRDLSSNPQAVFELELTGETLQRSVSQAEFDGWIAPELEKLDALVDKTLETARLNSGSIDAVFLTGGTSFVPAVKKLFESRFGADKVATGDQFVSIAHGLSLIGDSPSDLDWAAARLAEPA